MKIITELTDAQKAMMPVWRDKWIEIGLKTGDADFKTFEKYIAVAYEKADIALPKIIRVQSPIVGALAAAISQSILSSDAVDAVGGAVDDAVRGAVHDAVDDAVSDTVGGAVHDAVDDAVHDAVHDAVSDAVGGAVSDTVDDAVHGAVGVAVNGAVTSAVRGDVDGAVNSAVRSAVHGAVRDAVDDAVRDAVRGAVDDAVHDAVDDAVHDAVHDAVRDAVGDAVRNMSWHYWLGGQFWVGGWWGSPSYVSFFREVCGLELDKDIEERADAYQKICESVNYVWCNRAFVMVCDRPKSISLDEQGRLHNETGKAIEYKDGWGLYAWRGVVVPGEWITDKAITAKEALTWEHVEQRNAACQILGWDKILDELEPKVIHADPDPYIGTLLETELPDHGRQRFLRAKCGTGRDVVVLIDDYECTTARAAAAHSYGVAANEYQPVIRT